MNSVLLKDYTGEAIKSKIDDERRRYGFTVNWAHMAANYGSGVDAQLLAHQILLSDETSEQLYRAPEPVRYVKGTRPVLERWANEIAKDSKSDTERALAVMRFTRDLYKRRKGWHPFFGGTEEVLIEKGEELCECVSRLAVALCEVLGIPARIITHTIGGHVTAEVYADGKWGYIDPRCGMYFLYEDGRLASLWELLHDHSLLDSQSDAVKADVSPRFKYDERINALRNKYLSHLEVNTFKYYSLADADKYDYSWQSDEDCIAIRMNEICKEYGRVRRETMMPKETHSAAPAFTIRLSLPDGVTLSEDVMLVARMNGVMCHPQVARFYVDGELIYTSDPWIPISELSTHQHGVIILGGANGSLPVSTLDEGEHKLRVEMVVSPNVTSSKEITFFVKR